MNKEDDLINTMCSTCRWIGEIKTREKKARNKLGLFRLAIKKEGNIESLQKSRSSLIKNFKKKRKLRLKRGEIYIITEVDRMKIKAITKKINKAKYQLGDLQEAIRFLDKPFLEKQNKMLSDLVRKAKGFHIRCAACGIFLGPWHIIQQYEMVKKKHCYYYCYDCPQKQYVSDHELGY